MTDAEHILGKLAQAQFQISAPTLALCPPNIGHEVAFAGRSNAGKSSAINCLTRQRQLAFASQPLHLMILQHQPRPASPVDPARHAPSRAGLHQLPPADLQRAHRPHDMLRTRIFRFSHARLDTHADTGTRATEASSASIH